MNFYIEKSEHLDKTLRRLTKGENQQRTKHMYTHTPSTAIILFSTSKLSPSYKYPMKNENFRKHVI